MPGTAPITGRPSSVTGRKHACRALIGAAARAGEIFRHSASSRTCAPSSAATSLGSSGSGPMVEIAHTHVVPSAAEITRGSGFRRPRRGTRGTMLRPEWSHRFRTPSYVPYSRTPLAAAASAPPESTTVPSRSRRRRLRRSHRPRVIRRALLRSGCVASRRQCRAAALLHAPEQHASDLS